MTSFHRDIGCMAQRVISCNHCAGSGEGGTGECGANAKGHTYPHTESRALQRNLTVSSSEKIDANDTFVFTLKLEQGAGHSD